MSAPFCVALVQGLPDRAYRIRCNFSPSMVYRRAMSKQQVEQYVNKVIQGDCLEVLRGIPDGSVDSIVTDPP